VEVLFFLPPTHYPLYDFDLRATHARTLLPAALASVSFGFVLVRVRVRLRFQKSQVLLSAVPLPGTSLQTAHWNWGRSGHLGILINPRGFDGLGLELLSIRKAGVYKHALIPCIELILNYSQVIANLSLVMDLPARELVRKPSALYGNGFLDFKGMHR
jgi:hypothetical protein